MYGGMCWYPNTITAIVIVTVLVIIIFLFSDNLLTCPRNVSIYNVIIGNNHDSNATAYVALYSSWSNRKLLFEQQNNTM